MKAFISQPMKDLTNEQIEARRREIVKKLQNYFPDQKIEIIDSFFKDAPHNAKPLWYLGESIKLLSFADIVVFANGWMLARGCKIENICAIDYHKNVLYEDEL